MAAAASSASSYHWSARRSELVVTAVQGCYTELFRTVQPGAVLTSPDRYLRAVRRASTERRYAQAIAHFEGEWGGLLPASSESVVRYLKHYGDQLTSRTLRVHLAALASWH